MQLVLISAPVCFHMVDPRQRQLQRHHFNEGITFRSHVNQILRDNVTWRNGRDVVARKLISKLFQGDDISEFTIELRAESRSRYSTNYELKLKHVGEKLNILEHLRLLFPDPDKVKISVSIAIKGETCYYGNDKNSCYPVMVIDENYKCEGSISLNLNVHRCEFCVEGYDSEEDRDAEFYTIFTALVTITADINANEGELIASLELPVPPGKTILEQGICSDLTIFAMDGVQIAAHKNFLAACSPVLRAQFSGKWQDSGTDKLDMSDVSENGIKAFLRYAYYHDLEEADEDPEIAYELLSIAHKYEVVHLEAMMIARFLAMEDENISLELAYALYALVRHIEAATELKTRTANILWWNAEEVENLEDFKELLKENPEVAVQIRGEIANSAHGNERYAFGGDKEADKEGESGAEDASSARKVNTSNDPTDADTENWS